MSKGSKPRPLSVSNEEYSSRWDAIFGREKKADQICPKCGGVHLTGSNGTAHGVDVHYVSCDDCGHILDIDYR